MALKYKDYYASLGVSRDASDDAIKKAFRKLAREHHPDVAKDKKRAEEKFKEINEAYEVLSDPAKRRQYDELGADWKSGAEFRPPPGWEQFAGGRTHRRGATGGPGRPDFQFGGTGFSDFFESLFGAAARRRGAAAPGRGFADEDFEERGRDIEGDILVTLDEVMKGSIRQVNVSAPDGEGGPRTFQVKIPAGVGEGQKLRISGRGEAGQGGGAAGDLYLRVRLAKHPDFEVEGSNLIYEADLAPWEAVLGANLSVPTLEGRVNIKIPPGTQSGQKLRMRERGLPARESGRGDLMVLTRIVVPTSLTSEERKHWEQLAHESKFQPRD